MSLNPHKLLYSNPPIGRNRYNNNNISTSLEKKMNILDELDDFINKTCIVKRNKKSLGRSK
jgi:hypothetical protein